MARMPGATWIGPTDNRTRGAMTEVHGLVLHIQDGTETGTEAWFNNPASQASSHFLNPKTGPLRQLIDTADRAWAQAAGNPYWISVENEGRGGDSLTLSQVANAGRLLAWLHDVYATPLQITTDTMGRGLAYHGMGGVPWGNHPSCPGSAVLAQRGAILTAAEHLAEPAPVAVSLGHVISAARLDPPAPQGYTTFPADVRRVESALRAEGLLPAMYAADGSFGRLTIDAYARWQESKLGGAFSGQDADGIPGKISLSRLGARHGWTVVA